MTKSKNQDHQQDQIANEHGQVQGQDEDDFAHWEEVGLRAQSKALRKQLVVEPGEGDKFERDVTKIKENVTQAEAAAAAAAAAEEAAAA
jgi:hypothetical protein